MPGRVCNCDTRHHPAMACWAELEPWPTCSRICCLPRSIWVVWLGLNRWVGKSDFSFQHLEARISRLLFIYGGSWNREVNQIWSCDIIWGHVQTDLGATEREKWNKCKDEQRWKIMSSLRKRNRNNSPSVSTTFTFPNSSGLMRQVYFLSWIPDISDHKFRGTI